MLGCLFKLIPTSKRTKLKEEYFLLFFIIFHAKTADWHVKIHLGFVFYDFPTVDWEVTLKKKSTLTLILGLYTYQILDKS